jgi:peptidoglycan/LPS O-acetylase OafA/YrhL
MATTYSATQSDLSRKPAGESTRPHLAYLDGIRGLAALMVMFSHAYGTWQGPWNSGRVPAAALKLTQVFSYGHIGVVVFIVLSGYCLTLPVIRGGVKRFPDGLASFLQRRAWRILPPYYAALIFSLLVLAIVPGMKTPHHCYSDCALPAFKTGTILSHVFLVHNLNADWYSKIDYPMWSVALEWQLYFVFALILLPVWRRFGHGMLIAVAAALGFGVLPWVFKVEHGCFHFTLLFAFGMLATIPTVSRIGDRRMSYIRAFSCLMWLGILLICALRPGTFEYHVAPTDLFIGLASAFLIVNLTDLAGRQD